MKICLILFVWKLARPVIHMQLVYNMSYVSWSDDAARIFLFCYHSPWRIIMRFFQALLISTVWLLQCIIIFSLLSLFKKKRMLMRLPCFVCVSQTFLRKCFYRAFTYHWLSIQAPLFQLSGTMSYCIQKLLDMVFSVWSMSCQMLNM
jgi:hypothetical protein